MKDSILEQIRRNLVAIISLTVALSVLDMLRSLR